MRACGQATVTNREERKPFKFPCKTCKQVHGSNRNCQDCREFSSFLNLLKIHFGNLTYIGTIDANEQT